MTMAETAVKTSALQRAAFEWSVFADALGDGPFILGKSISAADIYAAVLLSWDFDMPALFKAHPGAGNALFRCRRAPKNRGSLAPPRHAGLAFPAALPLSASLARLRKCGRNKILVAVQKKPDSVWRTIGEKSWVKTPPA